MVIAYFRQKRYKRAMRHTPFLLSLAALAAALLLLAGVQFRNAIIAPGPLPQDDYVLIAKGSSLTGIGMTLEEHGVIRHRLLLRIAAELLKPGLQLKAGEYQFPARISLIDVLEKLARGDVYIRQVTIPEGLTVSQIITRLNQLPALTGEIAEIPQEGTLLPDTYRYNAGDTRQEIIEQMQAAMTRTLKTLWDARAREGLAVATPEQAVILASVVEKETGIASERTRIAGVFTNRLKIGMALQSDPTVIYGLTGGKPQEAGQGPLGRRLTVTDLQTPTPYNTYTNPGLPPGPIANPGAAAIEAVLHPEENNYLFFVADGTGGHLFASDLAGHNANVANWRRVRKASGK